MVYKKYMFKVLFVFILIFYAINTYAEVSVDLLYDLKISESYDNNIYLSRDDEKSDWSTIVNPSISMDITGKRWKTSLGYSLGAYYYKERPENNYLSHSVNWDFLYNINKRTTFSVNNLFSMTQDIGVESNVGESTGIYNPIDYTVRKKRTYHSKYSGGVKLDYQFARRSSAYIGYNHYRNWEEDKNIEEATRYNPIAGISFEIVKHFLLNMDFSYVKGDFYGGSEDFDQFTGNLRITKEVTKHFSVFAAYSHSYMDYSRDGVDYQVMSPSVGFSYSFSKDSQISVTAGYYKQDKEKGDDEKGMNLNADFNKKWKIRKGEWVFNYSSGYEETYFGAENLGFTLYHSGSLSFSYNFTRHFSNNLYVNYRFNKYTDVDPDRKDHIITFGEVITYHPFKWMDLSVSYDFRKLNSNFDENDYTDHRVFISIRLYDKKHW